MATCDEFQLGLEMNRHGAVPPIPVAELDEHLASCPACAAYRNATEGVDAMTATHWQHEQPIDTAVIRERVQHAAKALQKRWWPIPMGIAILVLLGLATGRGFDPGSVSAMVILGGWTLWRHTSRRRALLAATQGSDVDLVHGLRTHLDQEARQLRWGLLGTVVVVVASSSALMWSSSAGVIVTATLYAMLLVASVLVRKRLREIHRQRDLLGG
jgi:predicted anti-sigma-YlaC factor YlaD